jgi:hypothetical protein
MVSAGNRLHASRPLQQIDKQRCANKRSNSTNRQFPGCYQCARGGVGNDYKKRASECCGWNAEPVITTERKASQMWDNQAYISHGSARRHRTPYQQACHNKYDYSYATNLNAKIKSVALAQHQKI